MIIVPACRFRLLIPQSPFRNAIYSLISSPRAAPKKRSFKCIDDTDTSHSLSLSQTYALVKRFAVGLDDLGIPIGVRIIVFSPNNLYIPTVFLGTAGTKRIFSGANPTYTVNESSHQIRILDAVVLLIHLTVLETGLAAGKEDGIPKPRTFILSDRPCEDMVDVKNWRSILASECDE